MIASSSSRKTKVLRIGSTIASVAFVIAIYGSIMTSTMNTAEALVPAEEHWKYNVQWIWDDELRMNVGILTPKIIIQNETADRLEGYIGDQNGTRLTMYDGQQVVMVRYGYNGASVSKWQMDGRIYDGLFAIDIPERYKDADVVGIYVGNHQYIVDNGTPYQPQSWIFINSARMDYERTADLGETETGIAATNDSSTTVAAIVTEGSLIDSILRYYGLL